MNCRRSWSAVEAKKKGPSAMDGPSISLETVDLLHDLKVFRGFLAVAAGLQVILHLLAFAQAAQAGPLDGGDMDEGVLVSLFGLDEAETPDGVEPLYGSCLHILVFSKRLNAAWRTSLRRLISF
jgi:hypothetical protein